MISWSVGEIDEDDDGGSGVEGAEEMDGLVDGLLNTKWLDCIMLTVKEQINKTQ